MENKRMAMLVVMMLVMGNILIETEAKTFKECYQGSIVACAYSAKGFENKLLCPFTCIKKCIRPVIASEIGQVTQYFCKLGCATERCASSFSLDDKDHVEKVSSCVDSCKMMCAKKYKTPTN